MSKQRAFIKYNNSGRIIPGSLIIGTRGGYPNNGLYTEVPTDLCCGYTPFAPTTPTTTRAFVKYTKKGKIIPGSLILTTQGGYPVDGLYLEVSSDLCCNPNPNFNRTVVPFNSFKSALGSGCLGKGAPFLVYLTQECLDNTELGCNIWVNEAGTVLAPDSQYEVPLPPGSEKAIAKFASVVNGTITQLINC
jgi:hypothetical protein